MLVWYNNISEVRNKGRRKHRMPFEIREKGKTLRDMIDVRAEDDEETIKKLTNLGGKSLVDKNCGGFLCFIASYAPEKTVFRSREAYITYPEEFGIEEAVMRIKEAGHVTKCYFLLNSPGGDMTASYNIARFLREEFTYIVPVIPHSAISGGTLIALAGDEIIMSPIARLSDLGVILERGEEEISTLHLIRGVEALNGKSPDEMTFVDMRMLEGVDLHRYHECKETVETMENFAASILNAGMFKYDKAKAREIAHKLTHDFPYHGYPVTYKEARSIGLKVKTPYDGEDYKQLWQVMRDWLMVYANKPAGTHFIRFWLPK
jgi:hypothetical protein